MRAILLALVVLGAITLSAIATPEASATCSTPTTHVGCICIPVYYGGQGIRGGFWWRCVADVNGVIYLP